MAQMKQVKKKRKIRVTGVLFVALMFTFVAFLASSIFLKSYNVSLNLAKNELQDQIASVK